MSNTLPQPRPSVIYKEMDDGGVLYCTESEIYFGVNAVGAVIWDALAEAGAGGSPGDLSEAVIAAFPDAPADEVPADVRSFLDELAEAGLLEAALAPEG